MTVNLTVLFRSALEHVRHTVCTLLLLVCSVQHHTVSSPSKAQAVTREVAGSLEKIGRSLAGDHFPSIAKSVFANPSLIEKVVQAVGNECASLCSRSAQPASLFRCLSLDQSDTTGR